ncbi:multiheme c-type cytochrome [Jiella sp. M17.18]|uniref:multiheme c-type cytochrome n=1 Tax=Jiella sp. M17.18 TaxID=3234247 RepID=UPI0034DFBFDE
MAEPFCHRPRPSRLSRRLARPAEWVLYGLLVTGALLFDPFGLPFSVMRWAIYVHIACAVLLVPTLVVPFWLSHRGMVMGSRRRFQVWSGRIIEAMLLGLVAGGTWLLAVGNNGTLSGAIAHWSHLVLALPLALLVAVHAWRYGVLRRLLGVSVFLLALAPSPAPAADAAPQPHAVESSSLLLPADGTRLWSANFDAGSISAVDRKSGQRLGEAVLGGDIRTLAFNADASLIAATDETGGTLDLVDPTSFSLKRKVTLGGRPHGVVFDRRNDLFWVTATESGKLYGVAEDGTVKVDMAVAETPRGLALLSDGRLLVTHAFLGTVSIYDATKLPLKLDKTITLAASQDPDETVSQGLPRVLDTIAVSPDESQAWLPHELWNFDHPFQFQSTVFPAISVIALKPGGEQEAVSRRKQLFKQINITEDGNRTRIVSNPFQAAWAKDGAKVYVTMAGSEDLVVFDPSRALPITAHSKKAKTTDGAKAVQIYRHLPGENPRGLVVDGDDIFVQNAQSLDLSKLTTGGSGPFAKVKAVTDSFAKLVEKDPLSPELRRGTRLFHLANTSAFPDAPMAGDNWMSCSSCHVDGFNYSNRYLFRDTPVDKFHSAFTGHGSIKSFVAGDFVGDYIRMIENTQGGMGADTRFPTPKTDPDHPEAHVTAMMKDLHAYVTSPGNLPLLSTWLRGEDGTGSVAKDAWQNSAVCSSCHSQIFKDWSNSMHHLMGQSDPYYMAMENMAAQAEGEPFRKWCMGCHTPQALLTGETTSAGPSHLFDKDGATLFAKLKDYVTATDEGTGCIFCHRVDRLEAAGATAGANASLSVAPDSRETYPGEDSQWSALRWIAHRAIRAKPAAHVASFSGPQVGSPKLCASCHDEFSPGTGAYIAGTYSEWAASPYNAPGNPAVNRTCLDCHMHADIQRIGAPVSGQPTDGGPVVPNVRSHQFTGAQYHLVGLRDPKLAEMSKALLRRAATLEARLDKNGQLVLRVTNAGAGHNLPGGVSDLRQMWLDLTVTDANGRTVLASGQLGPDGHLPKDARVFHKVMGDKDGNPVGLLFWHFGKMLKDTRIPPKGHRDETFALPAGTAFPVTVDAKLMFRTFAQDFTDLVRQSHPDMPAPEPVEMNHLHLELGQD